jgi:hypothetical protein
MPTNPSPVNSIIGGGVGRYLNQAPSMPIQHMPEQVPMPQHLAYENPYQQAMRQRAALLPQDNRQATIGMNQILNFPTNAPPTEVYNRYAQADQYMNGLYGGPGYDNGNHGSNNGQGGLGVLPPQHIQQGNPVFNGAPPVGVGATGAPYTNVVTSQERQELLNAIMAAQARQAALNATSSFMRPSPTSTGQFMNGAPPSIQVSPYA